MSRIRRILDAGKDVATKARDVARGTATRVGSVGRKSETTIAPGTSTRNVGRGYGVRQRGQGSRAATRSQRGAATTRGTRRIAGGAAAAGGTGVALSGSGKTEGKTEEKKDDKKIKYNVGVSRGGVPFAEAFKHYRGKGQKTFTWNDKKYTTELKEEKKSDKKSDEKSAGRKGLDRFRSRKKAGGGMMKKKGYAKGGMTKKGYAKGGMTKKGYAKGGSVRGKPRGVGAALRGYGKALK